MISTGPGDRALSTTSKSVTPTSIASDKAISRNSSLFSPLPNLLEAFLPSGEDDEGDHHVHATAQAGGSSLTHEQKSEIPKHVASRSTTSLASASSLSRDDAPPIVLPEVSIGRSIAVEPEVPASQDELKEFNDRQLYNDPRPTPPTSPTTRTLVNYMRQRIDAAQLAEEGTAAARFTHSTYSNTYHSTPAPALEASASSPISDESLYQTTPGLSNGHHQSTFFNPHADFDMDECSEDEKEYIYLYGERRGPAV
jgi:hypothetical protein